MKDTGLTYRGWEIASEGYVMGGWQATRGAETVSAFSLRGLCEAIDARIAERRETESQAANDREA